MAEYRNSSWTNTPGPSRASGSASHRPAPYQRPKSVQPSGFFGKIKNAVSSWFSSGSAEESYDEVRNDEFIAPRPPAYVQPTTPSQAPRESQPASPKEVLERTLPPTLTVEQANELQAVIQARLGDVPLPRNAGSALPIPKPQVARPVPSGIAKPVPRMQPAPVTPHDIGKLVMDKRSPERALYRQQLAYSRTPQQQAIPEQYRETYSAFGTPRSAPRGTNVSSRFEGTPAPSAPSGGYLYRQGSATATPRSGPRSSTRPPVELDIDETEQPYYSPAVSSSSGSSRKRLARRSPPREGEPSFFTPADRPSAKRRALDSRGYEPIQAESSTPRAAPPADAAASPAFMNAQARRIYNSIHKMAEPLLDAAPVVTSTSVWEQQRGARTFAVEDSDLPPSTSVLTGISTPMSKKRKREPETPQGLSLIHI